MDVGRLTHMANQIATFFRSYPEDEACAGIRDHIQSFWTSKMRQSLFGEGPSLGLDPLVVKAFAMSSRAESPVKKETASSDAVGQLASDAG